MATRSNIILNINNVKKYIYRHWDGYFEMTGIDVLSKCQKWNNNQNLSLKDLFLNDVDENGRAHYESTDGIHGDIEWLYEIIINNNIKVIRVSNYFWDDNGIKIKAHKRDYYIGSNDVLSLLSRDKEIKYYEYKLYDALKDIKKHYITVKCDVNNRFLVTIRGVAYSDYAEAEKIVKRIMYNVDSYVYCES